MQQKVFLSVAVVVAVVVGVGIAVVVAVVVGVGVVVGAGIAVVVGVGVGIAVAVVVGVGIAVAVVVAVVVGVGNKMISETELQELERLEKAATPGPWVVDRPWLSRGLMEVHGVMPRANLHPEEPYQVVTIHNHGSTSAAKHVAVPEHGHSADDGSDAAKNMEFIAAARNAIPKLIKEIRTLKLSNQMILK